MKNLEISLHHAWLAILIFAFFILTPMPSMAEAVTPKMQAQLTIERIDIDAEQIARKKSAVASALRDLKMFAKDADAWFGRLDNVNAKIRDAQTSKGQYATFNRSQLNDELQQLKNKREGILKLNGGATIVGRSFTSMDQLKYAYANISQEETQRDREYEYLKDELSKLDKKRDAASNQLEQHERHDLSWNKIKINGLQEDIRDLQALVNDKKLWCISSFEFDGRPITQRQAMHLIKNTYLTELATTPGKHFNSQELAQRIIVLKNTSNQIKENMRTEFIPKMLAEIEELHHKVKAEELRNSKEHSYSDISGCWIIFLAERDNPVVNITKNYAGIYDAHITNVGVLSHLGLNHKLFSVKPISKTVFDGAEISTDASGSVTRIGLRLILSKEGNRMDYRADDILTMSRCN